MNFDDFSVDNLMPIASRPPLVFESGYGSRLRDHTGREYLDFVQGWAVNSLGHCPAQISDVLAQQAGKLLSPSPAYYNAPALGLAKRLVRHSCFDQVFFANSGAEANEGAIKLARRWGMRSDGEHRFEIITFNNAFHGRTLAAMSASGKPAFAPLFEPKVPGFPKAALNDLDSVRRLIGPRTVAVMLEPVQGEAGVVEAGDQFMRDLRQLTHDHDLLLIVDEVQTGVGRCGRLWAHEHAGIEPDIMTLGKGLGGGVPLAALLASASTSCFEPGDQGGTFNGNPLMTAVGCAVLDAVMAPGFIDTVNQRGAYLTRALAKLAGRLNLGTQARGRGLLVALELGRDIADSVAARALQAGLLINAPRADTLRFMPALNVTEEEIDQMTDLLEPAIRASLAAQSKAP